MDEVTDIEFPLSQDLMIMPSSQESCINSEESFIALWSSLSRSTLDTEINDFSLVSTLFEENIEHAPNAVLGEMQLDFDDALFEENVEHAPNAVTGEMQLDNCAMVSPAQLPTQISTVGSNVHQGSSCLPACESWPGDYNFGVSFNHQEKNTKGVAWTYSRIKDKLYVGKDAACPVNFSANMRLPNDAYIRVMALYTAPEQVTEIVQRCANHSMEDKQKGRIEAEHLIRCESSTATYHKDSITHRHSVVVPFENPPAGQHYSTYIYKFACFGSCAGGPNRRPLMLIFTLERGTEVVGRRKLDVKICACPGRDRKTEEAQAVKCDRHTVLPVKRKSESVPLSESLDFTKNIYLPAPKKNKVAPNKNGLYTLNTEDSECYEFLRQMKKFFEMSKSMKGLNPEMLRTVQTVKNEKGE